MDASTPISADLQRYLQDSRTVVVGSLDGLSEYDARRPLTPTGTNLLGLVKHLIGIELGYLGDSAGRPAPLTLPWNEDGSVWEGADMWATAEESREQLLDWYRTAWSTPTPPSPRSRSTRRPGSRGGRRADATPPSA